MLKRIQFSTAIIPSIVALALLGVMYLQQSRLREFNATSSRDQMINENRKQAASLKLFSQLPTTGYRNLIASWRFLEYFQYFGDSEARKITGYQLVPEFFAEIVRNDPKFVDAYLYLSPANSLYAGRPDKTVAIMGAGLPSLSPQIKDAYFVWLYKGVDELLFTDNISAAKQSYQTASLWAAEQNDPNSQNISRSASEMVSYLDSNSVRPSVRIRAWMQLMANAKGDQNLQRFILGKVTALGAKISVSADGSLNVMMPPETNEPSQNQPKP
jgi:hypothetical protein